MPLPLTGDCISQRSILADGLVVSSPKKKTTYNFYTPVKMTDGFDSPADNTYISGIPIREYIDAAVCRRLEEILRKLNINK